jgi:hypothetical protein
VKPAIIITIVLAISTAAWAASPAAPRTNAVHPGLFELGLNLGEPTGLSGKLWFDRNSAVEGIAAWNFTQVAFVAALDYQFAFPDVLKIQNLGFPLFVGIGGITRISAGAGGEPQVTIGLRVPLGILFVFAKVPIELSLDVVPGLNIFPATTFLAMGGIGLRYCF